ncbi:single-stranded DNA-binding protein [Jidongwangia harbinensis]|uniref:single-stranded DNA-binding protein n=1 Tax=Jidongwangia harbinensis TaxID=2878561 RepID=UPI001CD98B6A|nr:single-stranded DNA-binding protein [Jidongwangia harbinensis]MCA2216780.1 single-stranded DNA-binding protein [Jidongwangia harbinensis]
MFDTHIVLVGNVLTAPEWRRTTKTQTLVVNFRVASTSRRFDRENGRWVDGDSLRVRVNCWRRLAEGVAASITVGDPVVVVGRLYTRDWTDAENQPRTSYEMEAVAVGPDLARGKARFFRSKPAPATSAADGPEAEGMVRGETAEPVADAPIGYGEGVPEGDEPVFAEFPDGVDPVVAVAGAELGEPALAGGPPPDDSEPAGMEPAEMEIAVESLGADTAESPRRGRRGGRRQPVPA